MAKSEERGLPFLSHFHWKLSTKWKYNFTPAHIITITIQPTNQPFLATYSVSLVGELLSKMFQFHTLKLENDSIKRILIWNVNVSKRELSGVYILYSRVEHRTFLVGMGEIHLLLNMHIIPIRNYYLLND